MKPDSTVYVIEGQDAFEPRTAVTIQSHGFRVRTFPTCKAFVDDLAPGLFGCVVVDDRTDGMDLPDALANRGLDLPTIVIIDGSDLDAAVRAMKRGAADVVERPVTAETLVGKVTAALADHQTRCDSELAASTIRQRLMRLTPREQEVLQLVAAGLPNKSIARRLGIGHRTVEVHRAHIMEKLQAGSSAELILMAVLARGVATALREWAAADFGHRHRAHAPPRLLPAD